jgi:autoinducer 2-degrading protein
MHPTIVALIAEISSASEANAVVGDLLREFSEQVRSEPGNLTFRAWRSSEDPNRFLVYEEYQDDAAFREHLGSAHNESFNQSISPHVVGGASRLTRLTEI